MPPPRDTTRKRHEKRNKRSSEQVNALKTARLLALAKKRGDTPNGTVQDLVPSKPPLESILQTTKIEQQLQKAKRTAHKLYTANRRNIRLQKAISARKDDLKNARAEAYQLKGALQLMKKDLTDVKNIADNSLQHLKEKIGHLEAARNVMTRDRAILRKRNQRLKASYAAIQKHYRERLLYHPYTLKMTRKGAYTSQVRSLARLMVASGTAEAKVGKTLQAIGESLGVKLSRNISKRSVQRAILEGGVAADLQLAYEIKTASKISYSSDSTSHKHIEYESRTIALQVIDYSNPNAQPKWTLRTLGIGTSVNHTSETQVNGLKARLEEISEVFNNSPLAKREGLRFAPDDFAYRLIGTSGDHAADQKKSHELLRVWKMDIVFQRFGEEALFQMDVGAVLARLVPLKACQIEECGGLQAWEQLTEDEKASADTFIIREVGKDIFDNLPADEQKTLTTFIRTGCCMHKDLNCFKAGDKALQAMWSKLDQTPPILLANKDNAAVLALRNNRSLPTMAETRAEEVSKRGGSHTTMLGGLICRNKDKKKGQHDTYSFYMDIHVGEQVSYPDVTNTWYGTHGEAGGTLVVYHKHFINFMDFIKNAKDKPGETNIEKNFSNALKDIPTLTELCTLALYNVSVSRPFMCHVRKHDNLLDLEPFFKRKVSFLDEVARNPDIWLAGDETPCESASLDGQQWEEWAVKVLIAVRTFAPKLPHLTDAITAFVTGARKAFVERFSDEFKEGGGIDQLTSQERDELYFSSTNDANEGGLGSWRRGQVRRPRETLHKFNAAYEAAINRTEDFIQQKLSQDEDVTYLMRTARQRDSSGLQKKLKVDQIAADTEKTVENMQKESNRQKLRDDKAAKIQETSKKLSLCAVEIDGLKNDELNRQLDYHREEEKKHIVPRDRLSDLTNGEKVPTVPLKSHMKTIKARVQALKDAVERYLARLNEPRAFSGPILHTEDDSGVAYESDYHDDGV